MLYFVLGFLRSPLDRIVQSIEFGIFSNCRYCVDPNEEDNNAGAEPASRTDCPTLLSASIVNLASILNGSGAILNQGLDQVSSQNSCCD